MKTEEQIDYQLHMEARFGALEKIDVQALADECNDQWFNQTLCQINDCVLRVGIAEGEFHWHKHENEDELFYVVEGRLFVDLEDKSIELCPRECCVVPRGVIHRTRAPERSVFLMIEGLGISPTGD